MLTEEGDLLPHPFPDVIPPEAGVGDVEILHVGIRALAGLLHALFAVRSRQLVDGCSAEWALSYLSGLLIGADVRGAIPLFDARTEAVLIGDGALNERYAQALRRFDVAGSRLDGEQCALAGLRTLCHS